ncbi:hypothetical protein [Rickettsia endosymbiont of Oedothorax gibbosus]|uniref:hypothetical protein n=1 Tax=Rickettsia endosymbiont of Oedothorax gibbosus TaxID=931099 RepID=UPI002025AE8F|nr:hypothetical protein [Rickettsia endosymbiont of Oedothorax gibbosus]
MKTKQEIAIELYNKTFYDTTVQIGERQYFTSDDREIKLPCIETERFVAKAIYSLATNYAGYSKELQQLYTNTFANSDVVGKYASGNVYSVDDYVARINTQSARWLQGYPFAAFGLVLRTSSFAAT